MDGKLIMHIAEAAGGIDMYLNLLIDNFDPEYKHIVVLSQNFEVEKYQKKSNVVAIEQLDMKHDISFKDFKTIKLIKKLIKKYNPDIVYCHSTKAGFLGRFAKKRKNVVVYNAHGWAFNMNCGKLRKFIYRTMEKMLARKTNKIICISQNEYKSALAYKICKENKLICIYNGINYSKVDNLNEIQRESIGFNNENVVVGMIGRLCEQKGTDIFVNVARKLVDKNTNYRFLLIGNGPIEEEIRALIKDNNLDNYFHITGWVNNPLEYAKTLNVACLFSRWEGFGYAIEEYKALKLPIVASNIDAIPELLEETYDINDIEKLVDAIESKKNLTNVEYNKKFRIEDCAANHAKLFEELCK